MLHRSVGDLSCGKANLVFGLCPCTGFQALAYRNPSAVSVDGVTCCVNIVNSSLSTLLPCWCVPGQELNLCASPIYRLHVIARLLTLLIYRLSCFVSAPKCVSSPLRCSRYASCPTQTLSAGVEVQCLGFRSAHHCVFLTVSRIHQTCPSCLSSFTRVVPR